MSITLPDIKGFCNMADDIGYAKAVKSANKWYKLVCKADDAIQKEEWGWLISCIDELDAMGFVKYAEGLAEHLPCDLHCPHCGGEGVVELQYAPDDIVTRRCPLLEN